jgi:hypothetical protein
MNGAAQSDGRAAPRWTRRHTLFAGGFGVALLVVGWLVLSLDEQPPDTRDLVRAARPVTDDDNAFAHLVRAAQAIDRSSWASEIPLFSAVARGKEWNSDRATAWVSANDHVWPLVARAVSLPMSQGPIPISVAADAFPHVGSLRELAELATLRAWHLYHKGEHEAALAWLATWLRAAQRVEDSNSTLIVVLTGLSLHTSGRQTIDSIVGRTAVSETAARSLIRALDETRPTALSLVNALAHEHAYARMTLQFVAKRTAPIGASEADRLLADSRYLPFLHKPNRTERLNAENFRAIISQTNLEWPALRDALSRESRFTDSWSKWNPDNAAGRMLLNIVTPTLHSVLTKRLRNDAAVSISQSLIAVRAYETRKGTLPPNLAATVPTFLTKVPRDPFSGGPIRYSPEFRTIWSVGENHLDITNLEGDIADREVVLRIP